jgi:integrase
MSQTNPNDASGGLALVAQDAVKARGGSVVDTREDVWIWMDGPYKLRIDFTQVARRFVPELKLCLMPFLRGHSGGYVYNLHYVFVSFTRAASIPHDRDIAVDDVSRFIAGLTEGNRSKAGHLRVLLYKWVELALPGVDPKCADYLSERRIQGNRKGEAVRTRNPVDGPFSEEEYIALYSAVNAAYGRQELPLWALLLNRLLLATGGRILQLSSLKICDFNAVNFVLRLPMAKTGEETVRTSFLEFDIAPQTGRLISDYIEVLRSAGYDNDAPLFSEAWTLGSLSRAIERPSGHEFEGHCDPRVLSVRFAEVMKAVAPPTSRLDYATTPISPRRYRYTFGTRMAEEGCSRVVIANRLGHVDLQNVDVYFSASPKVVDNIDKAMGAALAPLARAFKGQLVQGEAQSTLKGAAGSRIVDFRISTKPVGSCAGKGAGCGFNKPVACYTCFRFEPWLDAPHEKVLERLEADRQRWEGDERMAAINDESIKAAREVIALCSEALRQRKESGEGAAS